MKSWKFAQLPIIARYVLELAGIALTYLVLAKLGLKLALINPSASPVWPATGFALSMVLLRGYRVWPAVFIAALIANATTAGSLLTSAVIASGNTLEALVGGHLIKRFCGGTRAFDTPMDVAKFALISIGPATLISATIGVSALRAGGFVEPGQFNSVWMTWWMGDFASALLLTPVVILWAASGPGSLDRKELTNTAMLIAAASAVGLIVFTPLESAASKAPLGFLAIAPLLWAGLRRGPRDTATVALVLACFAIWDASAATPSVPSSINDALMQMSMFVIGAALPSLALSTEVELRRQAQERLRESEGRLRLSNKAGGIGTFTIDLDTGRTYHSPELAAIFGISEADGSLEEAFTRVHRDDAAQVRALYDTALRGEGGEDLKMDFRIVRPGGEIRWATWTARVEFREGPHGRRPFRAAGACLDITELKRAGEALRQSEERFRGIYKHAVTGICLLDLEGRIQSGNPALCTMLGYTEQELGALTLADLQHPDDRGGNLEKIRQLVAGEIPSFELSSRYLKKNGEPLWVHQYISLLRDAANRPTSIMALVTDMSERKRYEEQVNLLLREVNHRSKNMLAVVQAIARHTAATKPDDFIKRFDERIRALAASQDLLVKNDWKGVDLEALVRSQLAHFKDLVGGRIELHGLPVLLSAPAAQAIGMALHELATNAGKYGALSTKEGRVEIGWRIAPARTGEGTFAMSWREHGGPPVSEPREQGFGSTVISRMAAESLEGNVELDFAAGGLAWSLECPAREVLGTPAARYGSA